MRFLFILLILTGACQTAVAQPGDSLEYWYLDLEVGVPFLSVLRDGFFDRAIGGIDLQLSYTSKKQYAYGLRYTVSAVEGSLFRFGELQEGSSRGTWTILALTREFSSQRFAWSVGPHYLREVGEGNYPARRGFPGWKYRSLRHYAGLVGDIKYKPFRWFNIYLRLHENFLRVNDRWEFSPTQLIVAGASVRIWL